MLTPYNANRRGPKSTTPEVQKCIRGVVNETPGISTRSLSVQVGVAHSTLWRVLHISSCTLTVHSMYRPSHYNITLYEECCASGSYNSAVQIITCLPL
jgi:hypothetical protein